MKFFKKPIFTGFAPNLTGQDVKAAGAFLFLPWQWKNLRRGKYIGRVEEWLRDYFQVNNAFTYDSGRTALHYALKALQVTAGDEVLVQAYTCMVVSNAINWTGAKPVYVDIQADFNMAAEDLEKKITDRSKVLIIQHSFGKPADLDKLLAIAQKHNLKVIEDCAHALGARYDKQLVGTFADIGMFSFGSDKIVSCGRGGALITNHEAVANKLMEYHTRLPLANRLKIIQHLNAFRLFAIGKLLYNLGVGKWILGLARLFNCMNKIIYQPEKHGKQVIFYPSLLPNSLAKILLNQLQNLEKNNQHRQKIAKLYNEKIFGQKPAWDDNSIWLRYTLLRGQADQLRAQAKKAGIILGNWYNCPIAPCDVDQKASGYIPGSCPNPEKLAPLSINLPTNHKITAKDVNRICKYVK